MSEESSATEPTTTPEPTPAAPTTSQPAASDKKSQPRGKRPGGGGAEGGGGMPRRRSREAMPTVRDIVQIGTKVNVRDLDDEIAGELEAAISGMNQKELIGADTSRAVRQQAGATSDRKQGKVLRIHHQDVFIEVPGGRSQGVLPMEQFPEGAPKIGDTVEISIEGFDPTDGLLILTRKGAAVHADWSNVTEGMTVEARVVETNKGGLSVDVNGIRGFMPIGQIDLYRVENAEQFVNQRLLCIVVDADPVERNLVVSRKALLQKERDEKRAKMWEELAEGKVYEAVVRNIKPYGAFVDLGGVDALLPIGEMSWRRIKDPSELVQMGQTIRVAVVSIDRERQKVSVTLKQLEASPWDGIENRIGVGQVVQGTVTRTAQFGAFVELEPGIEGLIPMSELSRGKVWRVADYAKEGQQVEVKVLGIDPQSKRISLSLRQAIAAPAPVAEEEEEAEEEVVDTKPVRRPPERTTPLRGGTGRDWRSDLLGKSE